MFWFTDDDRNRFWSLKSPNLVDDSPKMVNISTNWAANDPRDPCDLDEEDIGDIGIKRRYRRFVVDT